MRLLLIEDDESLCLSLGYQLRQDGFQLDICNDGEEGLLWARQQAHDLIILDRMLPRRDGMALLRQLRDGEAGDADLEAQATQLLRELRWQVTEG